MGIIGAVVAGRLVVAHESNDVIYAGSALSGIAVAAVMHLVVAPRRFPVARRYRAGSTPAFALVPQAREREFSLAVVGTF